MSLNYYSVCERVPLLAIEEVPASRNFASDANRASRTARAGTWPAISVTILLVKNETFYSLKFYIIFILNVSYATIVFHKINRRININR